MVRFDSWFNLETSDEHEKDVQNIGVYRKLEKYVFTLPVMSVFSHSLGASRACAGFCESTEVSRFNIGGLCLALLLCLPGSLAAEQSVDVAAQVDLKVQEEIEAEKSALSLNDQEEDAGGPLYAGTSMWFLLSIALLGSIAVQRRDDPAG